MSSSEFPETPLKDSYHTNITQKDLQNKTWSGDVSLFFWGVCIIAGAWNLAVEYCIEVYPPL